MPFSMHLIRGIFGHEGEVIRNGKVLEYASHGCVRFPHGAAERFFNLVKADLKAGKDVKFVIRGTDPRK